MIHIDRTLYTIGHSKHTQQYFLKLLKLNKINCIVDVRSTPFSKFSPQFNKDEIKKFLNMHGIYYIHMGSEFGARQEDRNLYSKDGYLDFEKTAKSKQFLNGVERISNGIEKNLKIAFMCTEKDPIDCHRNILVANQFHKRNYNIENILENGSLEKQEHLEKRLLDMYFPDRYQLNFMDLNKNSKTEEELIDEAYKLRNKDIGYTLNE
ncbi:DUF488 family protein [Clostridium beijerinckii]|uniref:DUF488 domain-containing protein n=1 Tax=Clostridium beijerinckii TaxID=1520 RepID=UPI00037B065C|nr:DUF488 domain-containing protein [Clostridium beijerinckii]